MSVRDFISYMNTSQIHRVAVVLFIALLGVGMGVGFSVASSNARKDADTDYNHLLSTFTSWQMDLTAHFTKVGSLAATMGAFASGLATGPKNMSAPSASRMEFLNPDAFARLGRQVYLPGVSSMVLAPGGVITQMWPPGSLTLGFDALGSPTYAHVLPQIHNSTAAIITGPNKFASRSGSGMLFWFPVHVNDTATLQTFWGASFVVVAVDDLLAAMNVSQRAADARMDFALWYTTALNGSIVIAENNAAATRTVMKEGMRMQLPIAEAGRLSYLAMYPKGGPVSPSMKAGTAAVIVVATIIGSVILILLVVYLLAYCHFLYRHRRAPANNSNMFVAALALRGAQPIADHAPLVAVKMFNEFLNSVKQLAHAHGCYVVCEIGDRCVCVVASDPESLMKLAQAAVMGISVRGSAAAQVDIRTPTRRPRSRSTSHACTSTVVSRSALTTQISEDMTQTSAVVATTCHPSVACHAMTATCVYDATHDVYFYGTAAQLGKLCGSLDVAKTGEVCWTHAFDHRCPELCKSASEAALTSHTVSEGNEIVLHVASWWKETGDERDNEDPSTAMAVLSDAYVRRMTVLVSEGKGEAKERKRKGEHGHDTRSGTTSNQSTEATALARVATLLHVSVLHGDEKTALEVIRRIVLEEKGMVVSAHEATIVAAFNLLSAGGHHQVRAADTVMRIREALPNTHFACSIQHGKVHALIIDGLVMCTGEAVTQGRILLQAAVALCHAAVGGSDIAYVKMDANLPIPSNGLCLLCCHSEVSSTYDCEAVDIIKFSPSSKPKIAYLLAHRRSGKATDDEWMYRLKDEEDQSPFAIVNAVFTKIAAHDLDEAKRIWRDYEQADGGSHISLVSIQARASIARHLQQPTQPL